MRGQIPALGMRLLLRQPGQQHRHRQRQQRHAGRLRQHGTADDPLSATRHSGANHRQVPVPGDGMPARPDRPLYPERPQWSDHHRWSRCHAFFRVQHFTPAHVHTGPVHADHDGRMQRASLYALYHPVLPQLPGGLPLSRSQFQQPGGPGFRGRIQRHRLQSVFCAQSFRPLRDGGMVRRRRRAPSVRRRSATRRSATLFRARRPTASP